MDALMQNFALNDDVVRVEEVLKVLEDVLDNLSDNLSDSDRSQD